MPHRRFDNAGGQIAGHGDGKHREVEILNHRALHMALKAAQRAPQRRHCAAEATETAHDAANQASHRICRPGKQTTAQSQTRQMGAEQHGRAPQHQQQTEPELEPVHIQMRHDRHAQRNADQPACNKGQQRLPVKFTAHGEGGNDLPGERAEHREHGGDLRLEHPGPERHGHHAKRKARKALHKTRHGRTQGHYQHHFHVLSPLI